MPQKRALALGMIAGGIECPALATPKSTTTTNRGEQGMYWKSLFIFVFCCSITHALAKPTTCETDEQSLWAGRPVDAALESKLGELFRCIDTSDPTQNKLIDETACNWFVGKSLETVWGFSDFKNGDGFFSANELADRLASVQFSHWTLIGSGDAQESNDTAAI